jgi:predicted RNase H-like HicB family nuclease
MARRRFKVFFEQQKDGYLAYVPELPDCRVKEATFIEARQSIEALLHEYMDLKNDPDIDDSPDHWGEPT